MADQELASPALASAAGYQTMSEVPVAALQEAIRNLHGCESRWVEAVPVHEQHEGRAVWQGVVQVFDLIDHPTATRAYAWSHEAGPGGKRRFVAVLHAPPVDFPAAAVRASIVAEGRKN